MMGSVHGAALPRGSGACTLQRLPRCAVRCPQQARRAWHTCTTQHAAAPHRAHGSKGRPVQGRPAALVRCASAAAEQPQQQPGEGARKRCLRCGEERTLFYFPAHRSQPDGRWVHCYACQYEQRLQVRPPRRVNENEHPPTLEPQKCRSCHETLQARWFYLKPRNSTGRETTCLACSAAKHRSYSSVVRRTPEQKECRQCQKTLGAACFDRKPTCKDGLRSVCKECWGAYYKTRLQPLIQVEVPCKRCYKCKREKPAVDFSKSSKSVDGLRGMCKQCTSGDIG